MKCLIYAYRTLSSVLFAKVSDEGPLKGNALAVDEVVNGESHRRINLVLASAQSRGKKNAHEDSAQPHMGIKRR